MAGCGGGVRQFDVCPGSVAFFASRKDAKAQSEDAKEETEKAVFGGGFRLNENEIAKVVVDAAFHIHVGLGPGLLETVYEVVLAHELRKRGLKLERQVPLPIIYDGLKFDEGFRADLIVEGLVIVELKSVESLNPVHTRQLLTQLRLAGRRLGLLINFGEFLLKHGIKRVVNGLPEEEISF
jgi:GxxExxY protein